MTKKNIQEHLSSINELDEETTRHNKKIVEFLKNNEASFVTEMAWELSLTEYQVKLCLRDLIEKGIVETISVNPFYPDRRLAARVPDQSAKEQAGIANFSKKRWFGLKKDYKAEEQNVF